MRSLHIEYINLARRPDRRDELESQLQRLGYSFHRWEAVDGKTVVLDDNMRKYVTLPHQEFNIYEVACVLSHVTCLESVIHNPNYNFEWVLILEDDAKFPEWCLSNPGILEHILKSAPLNYDAYMLGYAATSYDQQSKQIPGAGCIYQTQPNFWGTHAIAYRVSTISELLSRIRSTPISEPFDFWLRKNTKLCFVASPFQRWDPVCTTEGGKLEYGGIVTIRPTSSDIKNDPIAQIRTALDYMNSGEWASSYEILKHIQTDNPEHLAAICDIGITVCFRINKEKGREYIERLQMYHNTKYYETHSKRINQNFEYYNS